MKSKILGNFCVMLIVCCLFVSLASAYTLQNFYWEDDSSALQIDTNVNSAYHSSIKNAGNSWSGVQGSSFYFYNDTMTGTNRTVVQMGGMPDPNWLAYEQTQIRSGNYKRLSCVFLDNTRQWTTNAALAILPGYYDVETIALHELGHSAGLSHSSDSSAVMYPFVPTIRRNLQSDDITGIKARYPSNSGLNSNLNFNEIQLEINSSIDSMTEQQMAEKADLIVGGTVKRVLPAQWDTPDGSDPSIRTGDTYSTEGYLLYHDTLIEVKEVYKGKIISDEIYVRSVGGSADGVIMTSDASATYKENEQVILYLFEDNGTRSQKLGPVHYFAYPMQGQLFIKEDKIVDGHGKVVDFQNSLSFINNDSMLNGELN